MNVSKNCIALIKRFEGFSAKPYLCPAGVPTIGYGSTRYENNMPVHLHDIPIDEPRAISIMLTTLLSYEADVNRYLKVPVTQSQFDALVDFAYNLGSKNLLNSKLLRMLNGNDFKGAAEQFEHWVFADGKKLSGLILRRKAERELFERLI